MYNKRQKRIIKSLLEYYAKDSAGAGNMNALSLFLTERIFTKVSNINILAKANSADVYTYYVFFEKGRHSYAIYSVIEVFQLFRRLVDENLILLIPGEKVKDRYIGFQLSACSVCEDADKLVEFDNGEYITNNDSDLSCDWYDKSGELKYDGFCFTDNEIHFIDIIGSVPVISPELEKLVNDKFRTTEDKTLCWTRVCAIVSFLTCIITLIISLCTKC